MGSIFEMTSTDHLILARVRLAHVGISAHQTRTRPTPTTGPYLAVSHPDNRLEQVRHIVLGTDHLAHKL